MRRITKLTARPVACAKLIVTEGYRSPAVHLVEGIDTVVMHCLLAARQLTRPASVTPMYLAGIAYSCLHTDASRDVLERDVKGCSSAFNFISPRINAEYSV